MLLQIVRKGFFQKVCDKKCVEKIFVTEVKAGRIGNWEMVFGVWWYNVLWGIKRWEKFFKCTELIFLFLNNISC